MIKLDKELQDELKTILKNLQTRDQGVRDRQLRTLKLLDLYWKNIQNVFWNEQAKDWRNISDQTLQADLDAYYADKVINIYRAHGESIIAALSQDLPSTIFVPDDGENVNDCRTAEAWSQISALIARQQKSILILIRALYLMYNQGTIAAYVYSKTDPENGQYQVPTYSKREQYTDFHICPTCGTDLTSAVRMGEVGENQGENQNIEMPGPVQCPYCNQLVIPIVETDVEEIPAITGYTQQDKPRPCIEVYGSMNVRLPHFNRTQKECGYLILETESDKEYAQDIAGDDIAIGNSGNEYETGRWARVESDFDWEEAAEIVTWRRCWLRPWQFNKASSPEACKKLKKMFPKGAYFLMMNDQFVECDNESLDDHWIISQSPLSNFIHAEPLGLPVKPIQDIRSEIVILQLQSMEYGIPETWADPSVVDFEKYNKTEAAPGQVYPIKGMPPGRALSDAFTTLKTAVYPKEAEEFKKTLDADGQFVLGDFPSIYGGVQAGGSKTYAEYSASQARALQRLSISWKVLSVWWAQVTEKATRIFINEMREDEKFVKKSGSNWVNVWIRRADLHGKIGSVEPETNSAFPMSFTQKRDALVKLMEYKDPAVVAVITHPENAGVVSRYLGFPELYIPGDDNRNKQLNEIQDMLEGMQIPVDPDLDNHQIEFEAAMAWLNSPYGQDAKLTNIEGYNLVKEHARNHKEVMAGLEQQERETGAQMEEPPNPQEQQQQQLPPMNQENTNVA
jgi:hypothetical protein